VEYDKNNKTCGATSAALRAFNIYTMNKLQNAKLGHKINFNDVKVQKSIAKDAVYLLFSAIRLIQ